MKQAIVLFSGGLDSVCCLNVALEYRTPDMVVLPVYFNFGQRYAEKEIKAAQDICAYHHLVLNIIDVKHLAREHADAHIPLRNMLMITMAASIYPDAEFLFFGMLKNESCEDKNLTFVRELQHLLDTQFEKSIYRTETRNFKIAAPFCKMTKSRMLKMMSRYGDISIWEINKSIGCFSAEHKVCGACISCFNRWVARYNAKLYEEDYGISHPYDWMMAQIKEAGKLKEKNKPLFSIRQIWLKRYWLMEAYSAMDRYHRNHYTTPFFTTLRRNYVGN